jgi:nicotinamidase-related amidase
MAGADENQAKWKSTALLVVDMQNDFLSPECCLFVAGGPRVIPAVQKAVDIAREKGAFVVWVVREHHETGRDVEYFRKHLYDGTSGPTMRGAVGAALVDGLVPLPGEHKIVKSRFSAFFATNLDLVLRREGIQHVVVAGVQTPNCIRATAFDAVAYDYPFVTVLSDATGAQTDAIHSANLLDMRKVSIATPTVAEWAAS